MSRLRLFYLSCTKCGNCTKTESSDNVKCTTCNEEIQRSRPSTHINTTKKEFYPFLGKDPMWLNYSEKKKYLKEHKLIEAGDTVGGSRQGTLSPTNK